MFLGAILEAKAAIEWSLAGPVSADDLLPIMMFVCARAQPQRLVSILHFCTDFLEQERDAGLFAYALVTLHSVCMYLTEQLYFEGGRIRVREEEGGEDGGAGNGGGGG